MLLAIPSHSSSQPLTTPFTQSKFLQTGLQIGVPLRIIVLEDTNEFISYAPKEEIMAQERLPFDLLVLVNPVLKESSKKKALFFEGCFEC